MNEAKIYDSPLAELIATTRCPFAARSSFSGVVLRHPLDLPAAALQLRAHLHENRHIWALILDPGFHRYDITELARLFHSFVVLTCLGPKDLDQVHDGIESPTWRLILAEVPCFALIVSNLYPPHSQRFTPVGSAILIQPESSFTDLGISTGPRRCELSQAVAERFTSEGTVGYQSDHAMGVPKAFRIVRTAEGRPIRWWALKPRREPYLSRTRAAELRPTLEVR